MQTVSNVLVPAAGFVLQYACKDAAECIIV